MRRSRRCTTTSATACTARPFTADALRTSPTRSAAAARSRPGRPGSSRFRRPSRKTRSAGSPRNSPTTTPQATLFYESQTPVEKAHIAAAFRFELSKVTVPAIRQRMVASLVNVSRALAEEVAAGLGMEVPSAMPRAIAAPPSPEVKKSPALSLTALPGVLGIRTRQIAILVADGVDRASIAPFMPRWSRKRRWSTMSGRVSGHSLERWGRDRADKSLENSPSVLFDAIVLPDGNEAVETLARLGHAMEYVKDQYRHCKTILALGASRKLLERAGIAVAPGKDPGILVFESSQASEAARPVRRRGRKASASIAGC